MPTICMFRGIKIYINWNDHLPPHFHASFAGRDVMVDMDTLEPMTEGFPVKQLKMILGWAACHQEELKENWELAQAKEDLFQIPATF